MKKIKKLKPKGTCPEVVKWLEKQTTYQNAWQICERGDWMLRILKEMLNLSDESQLRKFTLAKARCAKLVFHLMKDERSKKAVEIAEAFGNGSATREELNTAAAAAVDAAVDTGDVVNVAFVAAAAADIADVTYDAAVATYAATAATVAAYAAGVAAYADARKKTLAQCANIVRDVFPNAPNLL